MLSLTISGSFGRNPSVVSPSPVCVCGRKRKKNMQMTMRKMRDECFLIHRIKKKQVVDFIEFIYPHLSFLLKHWKFF
jgi:hypothetical protein